MKALVLLSGGVDSSTCLALAKQKYADVAALALYYGQKHSKELAAAERIAAYYNTELLKLDLTPVFAYSNCSLLKQSSEEIPQQSYAEQLKNRHGEAVTTYVPFRNGVFLSVAASIALAQNCSVVYYGAHADDAAVFGQHLFHIALPNFHAALFQLLPKRVRNVVCIVRDREHAVAALSLEWHALRLEEIHCIRWHET